jgi:hypothetical protein
VDDELVKVVRMGRSQRENAVAPSVARSLREYFPALSSDYSIQLINNVRFAPLFLGPEAPVFLPTRVWSPKVHDLYPTSFRKACHQLLLCSCAPEIQSVPAQLPLNKINLASKLPPAVWQHIITYMRRDWFELPSCEEDVFRQKLKEVEAKAKHEQDARIAAEARLRVVERERQIYRIMAMRWQRRFQKSTSTDGVSQNDDEIFAGLDVTASAALEPRRWSGWQRLRRSFNRDNEGGEEDTNGNDGEDVHMDHGDEGTTEGSHGDDTDDSESVEFYISAVKNQGDGLWIGWRRLRPRLGRDNENEVLRSGNNVDGDDIRMESDDDTHNSHSDDTDDSESELSEGSAMIQAPVPIAASMAIRAGAQTFPMSFDD